MAQFMDYGEDWPPPPAPPARRPSRRRLSLWQKCALDCGITVAAYALIAAGGLLAMHIVYTH